MTTPDHGVRKVALWTGTMSLWQYLREEVTRGYILPGDEERYAAKPEKIYTFLKIPRELEKFMSYGFFHCLDSFLFVFTFLPIRSAQKLNYIQLAFYRMLFLFTKTDHEVLCM